MFTFNKELKLTFVTRGFIKTHSLPSMRILQNTPVITVLAFIVSPETESDHNVLWETEAKLRALRPLEEITYNLPIADQLYQVVFRAVSDDERIGRLTRLEPSQSVSKENEKVGGLLTSLILAGGPSMKNCDMTTKPSGLVPIPIKKKPSIIPKTHSEALPRILVVDDSDVNREVVDIFLAPDFPTPIHAKNGHEALDIINREQLDLVLMDIHMPGMNGIEATLAIREANAPWSNIIIIALTADTAYQHSRVYKNIGMNDAICKPIRHDVLIKTILRNWNAIKLRKEAQSARLDYAS